MTPKRRLLAGCVSALWCLPALAALPTIPAPAAAAAASGSGALQALSGLVLVIALIFALAWLARRLGLQRLGGSPLLKVVASTPVGTRERVVIVETAGTWLVLGVTPSSVNALHTLPAQASPAAGDSAFADDAPARMLGMFSSRLREALGKRRDAS